MISLATALLLAAPDSFETAVKPVLAKHCAGCHNARSAAGGMSIEAVRADRDRLQRIARRLRAGEMPPKGSPRPTAAEIDAVAGWIESSAGGAVSLRRLNRFEYANSVRDLLGIDMKAGDDLLADPYSYGFDNIADALSVSPAQTEKYLKSAERIARAAIPIDEPAKPTMERYLAERIGQDEQLHLSIDHVFPVEGDYTLRSAWYQALRDGTRTRLRLFLDGKEVANGVLRFYYQIDRGLEAPDVHVTAGRHRVEADIEVLPDPPYKGSLPYLEYIQIYGPMKATPASETAAYSKFFTCGHAPGKHEAGCARRLLEPLARRAWRRPVTGAEVDGLLSVVHQAQASTGSFEQAMRAGLAAVLVSPHFLFRAEHDRAAGYALATRLSYFLWSSLPDDELLKLAENGGLADAATLGKQAARLLASPKSRALVESFSGQWLQTRNLDVLKPDRRKFPAYDNDLREAMRRETEMFFEAVMRENRSILDFIDGRFSFLNEKLAGHYGIEGIRGSEFRRVELDGARRSGVLTQASVLTVSSYPTRTSPVIRGKWVLENILNSPPPPPPPNVPGLDEQAAGHTGSLRQQLEKHRTNAVCASCHSRMDPLGFGLENYDATGRWRDKDGAFDIDAAGVLPDGKSFANPADLKTILLAGREAFTAGLVEKMLTYALGRGLVARDRPAVERIAARVRDNGYRFQELIAGIAESEPFRR